MYIAIRHLKVTAMNKPRSLFFILKKELLLRRENAILARRLYRQIVRRNVSLPSEVEARLLPCKLKSGSFCFMSNPDSYRD